MTTVNLKRARRQSILISFLIATPLGLFTVLSAFLLPAALSGEGLPTMFIAGMYGIPTIGLVISFLFSLWYAAKFIPSEIINNKRLIEVSFRYSLRVNLIIWSIFLWITAIQGVLLSGFFSSPLSSFYLLAILIIPPLVAFVVCSVGTTFTIGYLICYLAKRKTLKTMGALTLLGR